MCRWEKDEEERRIKEEGKREKAALATWRKLLMGLRIIERVRGEYGGDADAHIAEEMNPFTNPSKAKKALQADTANKSPSPYAKDEEDVGGGFIADDDPDGEGFLLEGEDAADVRHRAGELTIEDEKHQVDSGPVAGSPSSNSLVMSYGPPGTDDSVGAVFEAGLNDKVTVSNKASTNGKRAATSIDGPKVDLSTISPRRRAAPKRKAATKSETALKSHFFEDESDGDDNSIRGSRTSKEAALKKPAKRKSNTEGSGPSLRARRQPWH